MGLECLGARLVPAVGTFDVGLAWLGARLVPAVGTLTWVPRSYGRNDLGHASFLQ